MSGTGSLACVGIGMTLGAHITPLARSYIDQADVVFVAASDAVVEQWIMALHADVRSLQVYYAEGKSRRISYRQMVDAMLNEVRTGKNVCGAFYGHPGVFAWAPHEAIARARAEGYNARMIPGVSAEDCLIADLGIDPGRSGCFSMEASQLLLFHRIIDNTALLILWQVGIVGDPTFSRSRTGRAQRELLVRRLIEDYPPEHGVILYEAAALPAMDHRSERLPLRALVGAALSQKTTLVIPPLERMRPNDALRSELAALAAGRRDAPEPGD